jgi:predicted RecA/RadA family phage recombinase
MKTKISNRSPLDITAPSGGTTSGVGVLIGKIFGIAITSNVAGDTCAVETDGVYDHTAEGAGSGQAWAFGDIVYWDDTNKRLTKTSASNTRVGVAVAAKVTTATTGRVRLDGFVT